MVFKLYFLKALEQRLVHSLQGSMGVVRIGEAEKDPGLSGQPHSGSSAKVTLRRVMTLISKDDLEGWSG